MFSPRSWRKTVAQPLFPFGLGAVGQVNLDVAPPFCIKCAWGGRVAHSRHLLRYERDRIVWDFLNSTPTQVVLWLTVLAVLSLIGLYLVKRFRDDAGQARPTASELLTNFRELHHQGDISEVEFRQLKTVLGEDLREELRRNDSNA